MTKLWAGVGTGALVALLQSVYLLPIPLAFLSNLFSFSGLAALLTGALVGLVGNGFRSLPAHLLGGAGIGLLVYLFMSLESGLSVASGVAGLTAGSIVGLVVFSAHQKGWR